jgi:hypothetical protein
MALPLTAMNNVGERLLRSRINAVHLYRHKMCRTTVDKPGHDGGRGSVRQSFQRLVLQRCLRRPAISLGAGAAHEHCPLGVAQAVSVKKGLDGLLVVDDSERARPVRAPQAAIETPGIEHAGERVPNVREGIRLLGQRAGAADLDHRVRALREFQHLREVGPGLRRRGRHARLQDAQMVDDESRVGMAIDERGAHVQVVPEQDVDRKIVTHGRAQDPVEARVVRLAPRLFRQHDADADRARRLLPVSDDIGHRRIVRVDRLDDGEPVGMGPLHLHRVAGVVAGTSQRRR